MSLDQVNIAGLNGHGARVVVSDNLAIPVLDGGLTLKILVKSLALNAHAILIGHELIRAGAIQIHQVLSLGVTAGDILIVIALVMNEQFLGSNS